MAIAEVAPGTAQRVVVEAEDEEAVADRNRTIHTIGNLTLVNGHLNSLSNAPWPSIRKTLADHSVLFLNKRFVNRGTKLWDEAAIEKRGKWLHKRAVKISQHAGEFMFGREESRDDEAIRRPRP